MSKNKFQIDPSEINQVLEDAWLGLHFKNPSKLYNPLQSIPAYLEDDPHLYLLWLFSNPEYFSLFCKQILNIQLFPMQAVVLRELWRRKFPMLIASRGASKCKNGNTRVHTSQGVIQLHDLIKVREVGINQDLSHLSVQGQDGWNKIEYGYFNGKKETRKITTNAGYVIETTKNDRLRVVSNGDLVWKYVEDIKVGDIVPIDRTLSWPKNLPTEDHDVMYTLGALIGDGGYTVRGRISFTNIDKEIIDRVKLGAKKSFNREFVQLKDKMSYNLYSVDAWDQLFQKYGFNSPVCSEKDICDYVWKLDISSIVPFLQGLFDTDGCVHTNRPVVEYTSKSKSLVTSLQYLLLHFGIIARLKKQYNKKYDRYYYKLQISGSSLRIFAEKIGFFLQRKQNILKGHLDKSSNDNLDLIPHELILDDLLYLRELARDVKLSNTHDYNKERCLVSPSRLKSYRLSYDRLQEVLDIIGKSPTAVSDVRYDKINKVVKDHFYFDEVKSIAASECDTYDLYVDNDHSFIANGFIAHNSFSLALHALLRIVFLPGRRVVITGSAFRQSKVIFNYMEQIWNNSPLLRDMVGGKQEGNGCNHGTDMWTFRVGESVAMAIPIGHTGEKVRGLRANDIISDEFNSIVKEVFETVIAGFGAVSSSPVDKIQKEAARRLAEAWGVEWAGDDDDGIHQSNQIILSGTCGYDFEHFADYWRRYKDIIKSRGNQEHLERIFRGEVPENFDHRHYAVLRIPVELLPHGLMDADIIARAKATVHSGTYQCEYGAVFAKDSLGFYKRSLIESVIARPNNDIRDNKNSLIHFFPLLKGRPNKSYVLAADPASENDNFSICVLELNEGYRSVVNIWTTTKEEHREMLRDHMTAEANFFAFAARKIRNLMKLFPTVRLAIDTQGGGYSVMEALNDPDKMEDGEVPLYPVIVPGEPKDTDGKRGQHIIEEINFASAEWTSNANTGMRKDLEDKILLLPDVNAATMGLEDFISGPSMYDGMGQCVYEIEQLKNELASIVMTKTPKANRYHWDTPETKLPGNKKGTMPKDRYSALLMANAVAHDLAYAPPRPVKGTYTGDMGGQDDYSGPAWFVDRTKDVLDLYGGV